MGGRIGSTELMPLKPGTKQPLFAHKEPGTWSRERREAFMREHPEHTWWGLLLDGLAVVDCDDAASVAWVEGQLQTPEAKGGCAIQATKKGRHYVYLRPSWADAEGYWDGARQSRGGERVDLKTRCRTGTRGLLTVAPSKDKRWERAPWEVDVMEEMPRALMEAVATARGGGRVGQGVRSAEAPESFVASCAVEKLLLLLGKGRWESYASWRDIATALKNSHGEEYRGAWERLSRQSPKYEQESARKTWETVGCADYEGTRLTLRTLERWARQDDPHGYAMYRASTIPPMVKENWEKGDYGLGQIAHALLKDTVKKTGPGRGDYYHFEEETCRWAKVDEGRVKSVACRALDETLRDVEIWMASEASQCAAFGPEGGELRGSLDTKKKDAAMKVAYVRSQRGITNVMGFAGPLLMDETFKQLLDSHRHLIGLRGGYVVDLRTGERRARRAEDMVHTEVAATYPTCSGDWVHTMMVTMMGGDEAMARYLQRLLGYGMTGEVREEVFPIFTGSGRNGKGILTQSLQRLMGPFYCEMNCAIISDSRVCSNIDSERAKLLGARLAVFNELKSGEKLKTNEVQLLTGGDGIPAKALYENPITIMPRHLCILTTNYMPEMSEVITAMVERLLCIEFPVTFRDLMPGEQETATLRQCDKTLKERLNTEEGQSALFAWVVEGAVAWYASEESLKRSAPPKVREFTRSYLEEQDRVRVFLQERCEFGEGLKVSSALLYDYYRETHEEATSKWFHQQMKSKGFLKKPTRIPGMGIVQGYEGFKVKDHAGGADELD